MVGLIRQIIVLRGGGVGINRSTATRKEEKRGEQEVEQEEKGFHKRMRRKARQITLDM